MTRLQSHLVDMRTRPDVLSPDIICNRILNCIDHFSKCPWTFSLKTKVLIKLELYYVNCLLILDGHDYYIVIE